MSVRRAAAVLSVALSSACAHHPHRVRPLSPDVDAVIEKPALADDSKPPQDRDPSRERGGGIVDLQRVVLSAPRSLHPRLDDHGFDEPPMGRGGSMLARPERAAWRAPEAGARPDDGEAKGRPAVRRPDEILAASTAGQPRYFSPKRLVRGDLRHRIPETLARPVSAESAGPAPEGAAARADFAPAETAPIADDVPEAMVEDPKALGSYHVQVSTDPGFGSRIFDHVYPFMADPDLEGDLAALGTKRGVYYVRYSIVDLLSFEHPFSAPQRLVYIPP